MSDDNRTIQAHSRPVSGVDSLSQGFIGRSLGLAPVTGHSVAHAGSNGSCGRNASCCVMQGLAGTHSCSHNADSISVYTVYTTSAH